MLILIEHRQVGIPVWVAEVSSCMLAYAIFCPCGRSFVISKGDTIHHEPVLSRKKPIKDSNYNSHPQKAEEHGAHAPAPPTPLR